MKQFHNIRWMTHLRVILASIMLFLMMPCLHSCESNMVQPEKMEDILPIELTPTPGAGVGQRHNEAVLGLLTMIVKDYPNGEKVPYEVFREKAVWWMNKIAETHGYDERVTPEMCDQVFRRFNELKAKEIYDFSDPAQEGVELKSVVEKLVKEGIITPEKGAQHLETFQEFERTLDDNKSFTRSMLESESYPLLPEQDILYSSAELWLQMEMYVIEHPELQGWWDRWKKTIREIGLIGSDFFGAWIGLPGGAGTALFMGFLGSVAFIAIWPPY